MQNSAKFFKNTDCSYFPCHKGLDEDEFNCLFCYCPLYAKNPCPGNPTYIKKDDGRVIKRCTDCTFPHKPENYEKIMNILRIKKSAVSVEEYHHGGECNLEEASLGANYPRKFCLDFSVNTNPLGMPENVKSAIKNSIDLCEKYPDQNCIRLKNKIAEWKFLNPEQIICGNGASELISLAVNAINPRNALIIAPTFSGYERALKICDCRVHYHFLKEEQNFDLDETVFDTIKRAAPDMIFVCNPNNPTGRMINPVLFEKLLCECEENGIFLFADECFIDFTERASETALRFVENSSHLIVLNAFTKIFAMAGLRLGYLVSSNLGLIQKINSLRPEWNVSEIAQIAGEAALKEKDYIQKTRNLIQNERLFLNEKLKALGFKVFNSEANFIFFENQSDKAPNFYQSLKEKGILIRNCDNFIGLKGKFFRIAIKKHEENEKLTETLREIL